MTDPSKPAQEVLFFKKKDIQIHPSINLSNVQVEKVSYQKQPVSHLMRNLISNNILKCYLESKQRCFDNKKS